MTTVPEVQEKNVITDASVPQPATGNRQPATEGTIRPVDPGDIDLGDTDSIDITPFLSADSTNLHQIEA